MQALIRTRRSAVAGGNEDARAWAVLRLAWRSAAFCVGLALIALSGAGQAAAQLQQPPQTQTQARTRSASGQPSSHDESDDDRDDDDAVQPSTADATTLMRKAHSVYVQSDSVFVKREEVEDSLRKRKEFKAWGMVVTRNGMSADLLLTVERKAFTRRFTFTVLDPKTMLVLTSGKTRSVLFGKKIPNKIAEKFVNRLKVVRPYPPA